MEDDELPTESALSTHLDMHMDVRLVGSTLIRHFCTKTSNGSTNTNAWPAGNYQYESKENNSILWHV